MNVMKKMCMRMAAAALSVILAMQMPVQTIKAAAAAKTQYFSELIISYGKDDNEAKSWLTNNGYKVLNQNLNEGGEGGTEWLSWAGLASEKRSVYLGYKTTEDPSEAITDMRIMNMNGGYDYQAYEKILEETKLEKENFLRDIMAALSEYRENYAKAEGTIGRTKAQIAHDNLNKFRDDDSGMLMGDLLLNTLKTEDEAAWEADPSQHADMVTILMQGNSTVVSEIMQNLAFAADTADDSWLNRAIAASGNATEKSSFDLYLEGFLADHPGWDTDQAIRGMKALYDDDAKAFAASLVGLQNYLANYTKSELSTSATAEEAKKYFEEHEFEDKSLWAGAANLYCTLAEVQYGSTSLLNYLAYPEGDYLDDYALLENYEDYDLPQRAKLYPLIAEMSEGQRCLLEYTAMDRMLTIALMDEDTWKSTYASLNDEAAGVSKMEPCSVFAEVNRDDFKVGSIAVTNAAQGKEASTGEEIDEGLFGVGISKTTAGIAIGGVAMTIAGITVAVKYGAVSNGTNAVQALQNGESIIKGGFSNGLPIQAQFQEVKSVEELIKEIDTLDDGFMFITKSLSGTPLQEQQIECFYRDPLKLTLPGSNQTVIFENSVHVRYKEGTTELDSIVTPKGNVYYADGRPPEIDEAIASQYNQFYVTVNPDVVQQFQQATQQLNTLAVEKGFANMTAYMEQANSVMDEVQELLMLKRPVGEHIKQVEALCGLGLPSEELSYFEQLSWIGHNDKLIDAYGTTTSMSRITAPEFDVRGLTDKYCEGLIDFLEKDHPEETELIAKLKEIQNNQYREAYKVDQTRIELEKYSKAAEAQTVVNDKADDVMTAATGSSFWKWFGVGMAVAGLAMSVYSAYCAIDEMSEYYHMEMLPIPRKMVDLGYYEDGSTCYLYYDCTKCNRAEVGMANETLGDNGDLNGDVMKQWLALYSTKDARAGEPIKAGFTKKTGTTSLPVGKTPLAFFGFDYAVNMTDTRFTYNDKLKGIYLYYQGGANGAYTGTVTSGNSLVVTGVLSALGGAAITALLIKLTERKREESAGTETTTA